MSADLAAVVLRWAVRTLPTHQSDWGEAMSAELAGLVDRAERRRFALGCTIALVRRPRAVRGMATWLAKAAVLGVVLALAWQIDVPRARVEALVVVVAFVVGPAFLRRRLGPVSGSRSARLVAALGAVITVVEVAMAFRRLRVDPPLMLPADATVGVFDPARAAAGLVGLTVGLGILRVGLARVSASRSVVRPSTLSAALAASAVAAAAWVVSVLVHPGAASTALPGLLAAATAVLLAGVLARRAQALIAGPVAAVVSLAVIAVLMDLLPLTGRWVANTAAPVLGADAPTRVTDPIGLWLPCVVASVLVALRVAVTTPAGLAEPIDAGPSRRDRELPSVGAADLG